MGVPEKSLGAMGALATRWRNDWSDFDGRQLRDELQVLAGLIRKESEGEDVTALVEQFIEDSCRGEEW